MKPAVSVALIVIGGMLVALQPIYMYLTAGTAETVLDLQRGTATVAAAATDSTVGQWYWFCSFTVGTMMILVGIVGAFRSRRTS